jgi:hypothetical protein
MPKPIKNYKLLFYKDLMYYFYRGKNIKTAKRQRFSAAVEEGKQKTASYCAGVILLK